MVSCRESPSRYRRRGSAQIGSQILPVTQEQARQDIGSLIQKYKGMSEISKREITEAGVVHQFLDAFLRALGWPVDDPERYKYELFVAGGRPRHDLNARKRRYHLRRSQALRCHRQLEENQAQPFRHRHPWPDDPTRHGHRPPGRRTASHQRRLQEWC